MNINLDSEAIRAATQAAIINSLTGPEKDKLLQAAIDALLKAPPDGYGAYGGDKSSRLEVAFRNAVDNAARDMAKEFVAGNAELRATLQDLLQKAALKMVDTDVDKLVERMAQAFTASLKDRY